MCLIKKKGAQKETLNSKTHHMSTVFTLILVTKDFLPKASCVCVYWEQIALRTTPQLTCGCIGLRVPKKMFK